MKSQKGSTHIVIIVILVIAVLGLLGFVFWQNFMNKKTSTPSQKTQQTSSAASSNTKEYTSQSQGIKFTYLTSGWKFDDSSQDLESGEIAIIETNDFQAGAGSEPSVISGAQIIISSSVATGTMQDSHDGDVTNAQAIAATDKVTVTPVVAVTSSMSSYQVINDTAGLYRTMFQNASTGYTISSNFAENARSTALDAYNKIVSTFSTD